MKITIKTKKVWRQEPCREIVSFECPTDNELPKTYLEGYPVCFSYIVNEIPYLYVEWIDSTHDIDEQGDDPTTITMECIPGDVIPDHPEFSELLGVLQECQKRLNAIEAEQAEMKSAWTGEETITIE